MRYPLLPLAALALTLAACDGASDTAPGDTAGDAAEAPAADPAAPPAAPSATATPEAGETGAPIASIPAAMQGRWALEDGDCDPRATGGLGLLTVDGGQLTFYESVATLGEARSTGENSLRGTFAYEGEGMTWSRDLALAIADGGDTLTLQEFGPDAPAGARRYSRCD